MTNRIVPILLHDRDGLVKPFKFGKKTYLGDPTNAIRIFNNKMVDELILLDISRSNFGEGPNLSLLKRVHSECFMPLAYGGGIRNYDDAKRVFEIGVEKIVVQSAIFENVSLINSVAENFGSQSITASIDVIPNAQNQYRVYHAAQKRISPYNLIELIKSVQDQGVGEIVITNVAKEQTFSGYDLPLLEFLLPYCKVPLIFNGGASNYNDLRKLLNLNVSAGAGSLFVFYGKKHGVLFNYPENSEKELWSQ